MARKSLPTTEQMSATQGALQRVERDSVMAVAPLQAEANRLQQEKTERDQRERDIAEAHETAGRIQALNFMEKVVTVSSLVQLNKVKESKGYCGIGTWQEYCNYLGLDRATIDKQLLNLKTFGEQFLLTVSSFGVGYREMIKLRQLSHDGAVQVNTDDNTIVIEGETIPIDQDHAEELQTAIEQIIKAKNDLNQTAKKLLNDMNACVKEETKGLRIEKEALIEKVKGLEQYAPECHDRTWSVDTMTGVLEAALGLEVAIQKFVVDPRVVGDRPLQAQIWAPLNAAMSQLEDLDARMRQAYFTEED